MGNPFVHTELMTDDVDRALAFYIEVFGWTRETTRGPTGPYTVFSVGGRPAGNVVRS